MFHHYAVQEALFHLLVNDAALTQSVSGVFDYVPQATPFPYIMIGEGHSADISAIGTRTYQHGVTLHVYSKDKGRKEVNRIMERLHTLLDKATPEIAGYMLIELRYAGSEITLMPDGETYHGVMEFSALLEAV